MAQSADLTPVRPSLLDRLIDDDPDRTQERPRSHVQLLRDLRRSVMRDVANLLNTRRCCIEPPENLEELQPSIVDYGLLDFTGAATGGSKGRDKLRRMMEEALRRYEPRFKSVRVVALDNADPIDRTLRFKIEGMLHAEPAPEPIVFDSTMTPLSGGLKLGTRSGE